MSALVAAALAGLIATPHCVAMCGGFASACVRPRRDARGFNFELAAWHTGRLSTYAVLGAIAGLFGFALPGPDWIAALLSVLLLTWFAASLAGLTAAPTTRLPGLARTGSLLAGRSGIAGRFMFGAVTGLLPCGMVYAALSLAVVAAHPLTGAGAMLAFGAATVPGLSLLSVGVQRFALRGLWHRRALAALVLVVGLWSVFVRASGHAAHAAHPATSTSSNHITSSNHATSPNHATSSNHLPPRPRDP